MKRWILCLILFFSALHGHNESTHILKFPSEKPWFTGPLLAPSGYIIPPGHFNIQPYLYANLESGHYDSHWRRHKMPNFYANTLQVQVKVGLLYSWDCQIYPQINSNQTQGRSYTSLGDVPFAFNFQLLHSEVNDNWPAIKLSFHANAPLGKYQDLSARRLGTDAIGAGSWLPGLTLCFEKVHHLYKKHYLDIRLAFNYQFGTYVWVHGLNTYGGDYGTHGKAYPGNSMYGNLAFQYNLTRNWALACDFYYQHVNRNRFSGHTTTSMTIPSLEQWSIAPAFEYNWNANVGLLAGVWFSLAGRNTPQFVNSIISLNVYH